MKTKGLTDADYKKRTRLCLSVNQKAVYSSKRIEKPPKDDKLNLNIQLFAKNVKDYIYTIENNGFEDYRVIDKIKIYENS